MRTRQVHLDIHTSEVIGGIGKDFSKEQFQEMLKKGHVNSITVFSKCHHGWAYHPTKANEIHPHLDFDLLGAQIEAAHEIGVNTPVYISAGLDEKMARRHPEWIIRTMDGKTNWVPDFMTPGYHQFCFNTPYLDYLLEQVREVLENYDADGIFLDIVGVRECYCNTCVDKIRATGFDPRNKEKMQEMWEATYANYTKRIQGLIDEIKPGTPVFHNGGHIRRGRRDLAHMNSHLELESLPTGEWGYQHFPISARYAQGLDMEFLGMTGKFHTWWGEFGGFKHPNALRWEAGLCLANGACCSIGDQLHPEGLMDPATYGLIGAAYSEVETKEEWCFNTGNIADVALLSTESVLGSKSEGVKGGSEDEGCVKILLEGKYLFDVIDLENDFSKYKVIILPDVIRIDDQVKNLLDAYVADGGKILASGESGLNSDDGFVFDFGAEYIGKSKFQPSYFKPKFKPGALEKTSFVMYSPGHIVKPHMGVEHGEFQESYFNRDVFSFCSHQHTPPTLKRSSSGMIEGRDGIYIPWSIFDEYNQAGSYILQQMVIFAIDRLLGDKKTLTTTLPAQGIVTLQHQPGKNRYVQHSLYATPILRGKKTSLEVIEDINPIYDIEFTIELDKTVKKVYIAPQMEEVSFSQTDGTLRYTLKKLDC
ncbi:MAG: alpha-amylase family protein, partial [Clostridia bacterium]|nr:alpha-amylase family protein [Clostridia bacterium]